MAFARADGYFIRTRQKCYCKTCCCLFAEGELEEKGIVQFLQIAKSDNPVKFNNLDVIISVGYRVKSQRGAQFLSGFFRPLQSC